MSKKHNILTFLTCAFLIGTPAFGQETSHGHIMSLDTFMNHPQNAQQLEGFSFEWGTQTSGTVIAPIDSVGRPANSLGKDLEASCESSLLKSLLAMRDAAKAQGGTKVTGIHSSNTQITNPKTEYLCIKNQYVAKTPLKGFAAK